MCYRQVYVQRSCAQTSRVSCLTFFRSNVDARHKIHVDDQIPGSIDVSVGRKQRLQTDCIGMRGVRPPTLPGNTMCRTLNKACAHKAVPEAQNRHGVGLAVAASLQMRCRATKVTTPRQNPVACATSCNMGSIHHTVLLRPGLPAGMVLQGATVTKGSCTQSIGTI